MGDDGFIAMAMGLGALGLLVAALALWKFRSVLRDNASRSNHPDGNDKD